MYDSCIIDSKLSFKFIYTTLIYLLDKWACEARVVGGDRTPYPLLAKQIYWPLHHSGVDKNAIRTQTTHANYMYKHPLSVSSSQDILTVRILSLAWMMRIYSG